MALMLSHFMHFKVGFGAGFVTVRPPYPTVTQRLHFYYRK